jgi:HK97 family phage prohead protease
MEKITNEVAGKFKAWLDSEEVKAAVEATKAAGDTGTFRIVITTENLDRYDEVIALDGWELDHYLRNPVVLWGHDHFTLPIGVTTNLYKQDGKLVAEGKFAAHTLAQEIRGLYDMGIVRASSVGFIEKERQGNVITRAELIEWSFVSVPANPFALSLALEKALNINELVTKGFMFVEKKDAEPEEAPEPAPEPEEKRYAAKAVLPLADQLRTVADALEALAESEEPERTEDVPPSEPSEEEKALAVFNEQRRTLQQAATILGDVLAEKRQEMRARLSK